MNFRNGTNSVARCCELCSGYLLAGFNESRICCNSRTLCDDDVVDACVSATVGPVGRTSARRASASLASRQRLWRSDDNRDYYDDRNDPRADNRYDDSNDDRRYDPRYNGGPVYGDRRDDNRYSDRRYFDDRRYGNRDDDFWDAAPPPGEEERLSKAPGTTGGDRPYIKPIAPPVVAFSGPYRRAPSSSIPASANSITC